MATVVLPELIQLVQHHVRQQRGDGRTLGYAPVTQGDYPSVQDADSQPPFEQLHHPSIVDALFHQLHELRLGRNPYELSRKSASKIGSSTSFAAA